MTKTTWSTILVPVLWNHIFFVYSETQHDNCVTILVFNLAVVFSPDILVPIRPRLGVDESERMEELESRRLMQWWSHLVEDEALIAPVQPATEGLVEAEGHGGGALEGAERPLT